MAKTPILPPEPEPDTGDDPERGDDPTPETAAGLDGTVGAARERLLAAITLAADAVAAEAGHPEGDIDLATRWANIAGMVTQTLDLFETAAARIDVDQDAPAPEPSGA